MIKVSNISHSITNTQGRVEKRRVTVRGRMLSPGAHTTFDDLPVEVEGLRYDPKTNPSGYLLVEEVGAVSPRPADPPEGSGSPVDIEPGAAPEEDGAPVEAGDANEEGSPESEGDSDGYDGYDSEGDDGSEDDGSDEGDENSEGEGAPEDDGASDEDSSSSEGDATPLAADTAAPGSSLSLAASKVPEALAGLSSAEAVEGFIQGDGRPTVTRAAERRLKELADSE